MPPDEVIDRLDLKPGMVVADIGAGTGFFALPFARAVAPAGMVWAVDLQPAMLKILEEKLHREGAPDNIGFARDRLRIPVFRMAVAIWPFWETSGMSWTNLIQFWRNCGAYCVPAGVWLSSIGAPMCHIHLDRRQNTVLPPAKRRLG
jgi:SAM-dependent methyltransferase